MVCQKIGMESDDSWLYISILLVLIVRGFQIRSLANTFYKGNRISWEKVYGMRKYGVKKFQYTQTPKPILIWTGAHTAVNVHDFSGRKGQIENLVF